MRAESAEITVKITRVMTGKKEPTCQLCPWHQGNDCVYFSRLGHDLDYITDEYGEIHPSPIPNCPVWTNPVATVPRAAVKRAMDRIVELSREHFLSLERDDIEECAHIIAENTGVEVTPWTSSLHAK